MGILFSFSCHWLNNMKLQIKKNEAEICSEDLMNQESQNLRKTDYRGNKFPPESCIFKVPYVIISVKDIRKVQVFLFLKLIK